MSCRVCGDASADDCECGCRCARWSWRVLLAAALWRGGSRLQDVALWCYESAMWIVARRIT